ncbi:MAG: hypothetical protein DDT38_00607 [Firmicutes bacterium]|nr:hypothetical protein [candidate division NPL-UPA2 bacterium]
MNQSFVEIFAKLRRLRRYYSFLWRGIEGRVFNYSNHNTLECVVKSCGMLG